ncbi:MAG: hypothetical protein GY861_16790 [bacterium]|nr:hypothetical protein [bacterium]
MTKKFEEIMNTVDNDVLNENSKKAIVEAFETAVNEKVDARVKLEVEEAAIQLDESHAAKLQTLLEAIDTDHVNKLKKVLAKVDGDYAEKLEQVIEKYETMVQEEAIEFRDQLTNEMSNFMDMYLDTMLPEAEIQEAVENTQAKKIVEAVKELVSIDEDYITDTIRDALKDGKNRLDSLSQELNEAVKVNIQMNQDLKKTKSSLVLEQKTAEFDVNKKHYVMRVLNEKSPDEIEENFDYVVEMFERDEAAEAEVLTEKATKAVQSKVVDTPVAEKQEEPITESAPVAREEASVNGYLSVLKEQDN